MYVDWLGNEITVDGEDSRNGVDDFIEGLLGYEIKAANILKTADQDSGCCIANAYAALFYMFLESSEAPDQARPYLARAEAAAQHATRRERMNTAAARAWVENDIPKAIRLAHEIVEEYPRDLTMVKIAQYHEFNLGNPPGMLSIARKVASANDEISYMHGLAAFACEQCHLLDAAEDFARRAISIKRKEPWAHHALAHLLGTRGRIEESIEFLEDVSETWTDLNSFMVTHNWWHLALNYVSTGRYGDALDAYDERIWGVWKEYSQDQIGAVSLLLRLELAGIDVGERWKDVADQLRARVSDFVQPFLTMQYVYGLARAGYGEADQLLANLRAFAPGAPEFVRSAWCDVTLPACEGLVAHARGDHERVVERLGGVLSRLIEVGGSHAQRDLFEQVMLDSLIRTGRYTAAQQMLEMRRRYEPCSVPTNNALARVYRALDLADEAARAEDRVSQSAARSLVEVATPKAQDNGVRIKNRPVESEPS